MSLPVCPKCGTEPAMFATICTVCHAPLIHCEPVVLVHADNCDDPLCNGECQFQVPYGNPALNDDPVFRIT